MDLDGKKANEDQTVPPSGLSGTELLRYFSLQASELVDEKIRSREEQRAKRVALMLTFLSLVGVSGAIALANYTISSQVDERFARAREEVRQENQRLIVDVERQLAQQQALLEIRLSGAENSTEQTLGYQGEVLKQQEFRIQGLSPQLDDKVRAETSRVMRDQVDDLRTDLRTEVDYQRLNTLALSLDLKDSFANTERDAVMDLLRRLKGTEVTQRSDFQEVLRKIVFSFKAADQSEQIDEVDDIVGESLLSSPIMVEALINHYGKRVAGSRRRAEDISQEINRLRRYLAKGRQYDMAEQEIFWELLLDLKYGTPENANNRDEAFQALSFLEEGDRSFFFIKLIEYSVPPLWSNRDTYESTEISRLCRLLRNKHREQLQKVFGTIPDARQTVLAQMIKALDEKKLNEEAITAIAEVLEELAGDAESKVTS